MKMNYAALFFIGLLASQVEAATASSCITIYYPEVRPAFQQVMNDILEGIEETATVPARRFKLNVMESNVTDCAVSLNIGIGREGVQTATQSTKSVIAAAVYTLPGESVSIPTFSLFPDPIELVKRIKYYNPKVQRIHLVFNPAQSNSFAGLLNSVVTDAGIELVTYPATDTGKAFTEFRNIMSIAKKDTDSVLLWSDPAIINTNITLPLIIKEAWRKNIIVFSNHAAFVQYGILFGVYPDNRALGRQLGVVASQCLTKSQCPENKVYLLNKLNTAVSEKNAQHNSILLNPGNNPYLDKVLK